MSARTAASQVDARSKPLVHELHMFFLTVLYTDTCFLIPYVRMTAGDKD